MYLFLGWKILNNFSFSFLYFSFFTEKIFMIHHVAKIWQHKNMSTLTIYCMFAKRLDIFQNISNHFIWMHISMSDLPVFSDSFFCVFNLLQ